MREEGKGGRQQRIGPVPAECDADIMSALLLALSATGWHGSSVGVLQLQHRLPQPFSHRASPLLMQWDDFDDEEESEPSYTGPPLPEQVQALLLQCAIQTQLSYYNEFKNEMRARWLESFLGHEHLKVERTSDRGGGYAPFRGLSDGLRCSFTEYLKTMLSGKAERYEIRYKIGTADTAGQANPLASAAAEASAGEAAGSSSSEAPWAAASASRAANPYLKQERKEQYKTFTEIVDPRMVAQGLMSICRQISAEWSKDLLAVSRESAYLRGVCGDDGEAYADAFEGGLSGGVSFAADGEGGGSPMPDECDIDVAPQNLLGRDYAAGNVTLDAMCNDQSIGLPVSIPKPAEARRSPPKPAEARRSPSGSTPGSTPGTYMCNAPDRERALALGRSGCAPRVLSSQSAMRYPHQLLSSRSARLSLRASLLSSATASRCCTPRYARRLRRGTPTSRIRPPPFAPRTLTCCSARRRARPCCLRCSIWRVTTRRRPTLSTRRRPPPRSGCVPSSTSGCRALSLPAARSSPASSCLICSRARRSPAS